MKIFHLADLHIRDQDIEECWRCLNAIRNKAFEEEPDAIIVAGDTFDSQGVKLDSESARLAIGWYSEIAEIAPVFVVSGTPIHDGKTVDILGCMNNSRIWVSSAPEQVYLCNNDEIWCATDFWEHAATEPEHVKLVLSMVPTPTKQWWPGLGSIS